MSHKLRIKRGWSHRVFMLCGTSAICLLSAAGSGLAQDLPGLIPQALGNSAALSAYEAREEGAAAAIDEARAAFLPTLGAKFSYGHNSSHVESGGTTTDRSAKTYSYGVSATLPLFRGGQHVHGLKSARFEAKAVSLERFDKEQEISLEAVDAYLSVIRDRQILSLRNENTRNLTAIRSSQEVRFRLGEGTRTDIALARIQLELTRSEARKAQGRLRNSELTYEKLSGGSASALMAPGSLHHLLPRSAAEVRDRAARENPKVKVAVARSAAARHAAKAKFGEALPSVDLTASYDWSHDQVDGADREETGYIGVSVSIPLFAPQTYAGVRKSRALSRQREYEAQDAAIGVQYAADIAWGDYLTAKDQIVSLQARKKAALDAEFGIRKEYDAGVKDVSDLLDARERVVDAEIDLAFAEYDHSYAAYVVLATIGELGGYDETAYLPEYSN